MGDFGQAPQDFALRLLKEDKVQFMASDAHNNLYRPPKLADAFSFLSKSSVYDLLKMKLRHNSRVLTESLFKFNPFPFTDHCDL